MALIENGNNLAAPVILPNWTINGDGFGLITSTTKYKGDWTVDYVPFVARGTPHPDSSYAFLKSHNYVISWDALGIATITIDYVGIDPSINEGNFTNPKTSGANGLTAENITSHPNFFEPQDGYLGAIAGPAPYTQDAPNNLAPNVNGAPAFLGLNGSCFERESGGRFIGFVDPSYKQFYGKTQYLATTTTFSGVIYVLDDTLVTDILGYLNTTTSTTAWGTWDLLPDWAKVGTAAGVGNVNLLSQVNVEEYGTLFKVSYEIRYAERGWDVDVYKNGTSAP
jgi:hypothetical protein